MVRVGTDPMSESPHLASPELSHWWVGKSWRLGHGLLPTLPLTETASAGGGGDFSQRKQGHLMEALSSKAPVAAVCLRCPVKVSTVS